MLRVLVYSSYCICTDCMKACFRVSYRRLICSVGGKTVVQLSFMNDVHIFFYSGTSFNKVFFVIEVEVKRDCKA